MSTPPTAPTPSLPPTSPPAAPKSRKMLYLGAVVAIVVVALLIVFVVAPALTGGGAAAILTYSGARPVADRAVAGFGGGGWTLLLAAGLVSATNETIPVNSTAFGNLTSYCTYTPVASLANLTLPGFTGNRSSGQSPAWEFAYRNATGTMAIVSVMEGKGSVLLTIGGVECTLFAQLLTAIPGNAIDSSQATAAVEPMAAAFLAAHPNASAEFALIGGINSLGVHLPGPDWSIIYNTCALSTSPSGTGDQFNATVNALTGAVTNWTETTGVSCGGVPTAASHSPGTPTYAPVSIPVPPRGSLRPVATG